MLLVIEGIAIDFPFKPYDSQISYMTSVIRCLNNSSNALLESPTGTGKTLCLLCATLAWTMEQERKNGKVPLIIYSSRTHSQLSQISIEIKKTSYKPKIGLLGSREHLCSNEEVKKMEDPNVMALVCKQKVKKNQCQQMLNLSSLLKETQTLPDIEDIKIFSEKHRTCAFYLTKEMISSSNLLLLPYNYLLDRQIQKSILSSLSEDGGGDGGGNGGGGGVNDTKTDSPRLQGAIVILDEAHNIEGVCEDLSSIELDSHSLERCLAELEAIRGRFNNKDNLQRLNDMDQDIVEEDITMIKTFVEQIIIELNLIPLTSVAGDDDHKHQHKQLQATFGGMYIYDFFSKVLGFPSTGNSFGDKSFTFSKKKNDHLQQQRQHQHSNAAEDKSGIAEFVGKIDLLVEYYFAKMSSKTSFLDRLSTTIKGIFSINKEGNVPNPIILYDESHSYRTSISIISIDGGGGGIYRKMSWWCFNAHIAIKQLMSNNLHSLILTSGTLAPLKGLEDALKVRFNEKLENQHVIDSKTQLRSLIISKGPRGIALNSSFTNRNSPEYIEELGLTIESISKHVPSGTLVFFPSYSLMDLCLQRWRLKGIIVKDRMRGIGGCRFFVEPKSKHLLPSMIEDYGKEVLKKKAIFFAVCRGKLSEGVNFTDSLARAVIITGIPFPPFKDRRIQLKKEFMDSSGSASGGGENWYIQQGFKAINQAIGRVIRSVRDYGSIIFLDERFKILKNKSMLSNWVKPEIIVIEDDDHHHNHNNHNNHVGDSSLSKATQILDTFFKSFDVLNINEIDDIIEVNDPYLQMSCIGRDERRENLLMVKKFFIKNEANTENGTIGSTATTLTTDPDQRGEKMSFTEIFNTTTPKKSFVDEIKSSLKLESISLFKKHLRDWRKDVIEINEMIDLVIGVFWNDVGSSPSTFNEVIKSFKSFIPSKNISYYEKAVSNISCPIIEGPECPICKESVKNGFKSKCDHVACLECWTLWLGKRLECPLCRMRVRVPQLRKITK